jgi:hypothetical protein
VIVIYSSIFFHLNIDTLYKMNTPNMSEASKHTHPPVRGLVDGCEYCKTRGNVFQHGTFQMERDKLKNHMICFQSTQSFKK